MSDDKMNAEIEMSRIVDPPVSGSGNGNGGGKNRGSGYSGEHSFDPHRASYDRWYGIAREPLTDPDVALAEMARVFGEGEEAKASRSVYRVIASSGVAEAAVMNRDARKFVEVAVRLDDYEMPNAWFVSTADNIRERRETTEPVKQLMDKTESLTALPEELPIYKMRKAHKEGFGFTNTVTEEQISDLAELWVPTFDWKIEDIRDFPALIKKELSLSPKERGHWFSGLTLNGRLVAASMAARTEIPGIGKGLNTIESTEWSNPQPQLKGYMSAALTLLNAQILEDLSGGDKIPFVYAETNLLTAAPWTGNQAGFTTIPHKVDIGDRKPFVPQVMFQNVKVGDGRNSRTEYRDFAFELLTKSAVDQFYGPRARQEMLSYIK